MANYYKLRLQAISFKKTGQENNGKQLLISVTVSVFRQDSFILVVTSNDIASDKMKSTMKERDRFPQVITLRSKVIRRAEDIPQP